MQQENFNPDILDESQSTTGSDSDKKTVTSTSFFKRITSFFRNGRTRFLFGLIISFFALFLLLAFFSYFSNGSNDQSIILNGNSVELAKSATPVGNNSGTFGATISHTVITEWVGISAFIIVFWLMAIGISLMGIKKIKFYPLTLISLLSIITLSMVIGFCSLAIDSFISFGGYHGRYVNEFLVNFVGYYGAALINIILVVAFILLCFNTIKSGYQKAKNIIPNFKHFDGLNHIVEKSKGKSKTGQEFEDVEKVPEKEEIEPLKAVKEESKPKKKASVPTIISTTDDDGVPMVVKTGEIEKAESIDPNKQEIFDPTLELSRYKFPSTELLRKTEIKEKSVDIKEQEDNKKRITETLNNYGIPIKNIEVCVGPTVTLFEIIPADGVRISKIKNLEDDIALSLSALGIRIIAPIPGRGTIGIEVPNREPQTVSMRSIIESKKYQECKYDLPMAMGCTISNEVYIADLCKMPHMLVAGATGQGKSVGLNAIITSLIYRKHPAELKFVLIDPKMVEFSLYSKLEHHYLAKLPGEEDAIITDPQKVIATLNSLAIEMDNRYSLLKDAQVRNIKEYNAKFVNHRLNPEKGHRFLPYIVVIVDEFCDLIMMAGKEVEMPIARIAQKARAIGIHMIIATQRPSTNVITGIIKANFPGRIAFRVTQMVDSRTILDCTGAQQLIGRGDMLFLANGEMDRIQCAFIDTPEVEAICAHIDTQIGYEEAYQLPEYIANQDGENAGMGGIADRDPLFEEAAAFIVAGQTASTSSLQRRYSIGYNRAGKIMDQMEASGIVGPAQGGKPRQVLIDSIQLSQKLEE
ncbi:MAG: DNA translocase FtsK [Muribaculaceae bacterium]